MAARQIFSFPSSKAISDTLDAHIAVLSAKAIASSGKFTIAVSGGSLPTILAATLKSNTTIDFSKWHLFYADERCVPLDHADSNHLAVQRALLDHVPIPAAHVHTLTASLAPAEAAKRYEQDLRAVFGDVALPEFDLILLGVGPDGHTCSLFPDHPLLDVKDRWVAHLLDSPKPPPARITLTYPVVNNAETVIFVATGAGKQDMFHDMFDKGVDFPSGRVTARKNLFWFLDEPAAVKVSARSTEAGGRTTA
ncbi:6-phosphogluconolactonase-like protein [Blyttiomyces helicus]|uniref:6-phosphogluconolactonase n=1 Tax=Blyttiomyces helicus TaxID=388810 RepID=A0A4P9WMC0_9FUNG|nr:6-phosphogluconolactonase-like protein [Blyttiomyces helicus]|eukprot:RKO92320.1 6-phosphogluconolactonase-like protein [Blyttiomyces helicus]